MNNKINRRLLAFEKSKTYLTDNEWARNVFNRAEAVWNITGIVLGQKLKLLDKQDFQFLFSKIETVDRAIRQVQQKNPNLKHEKNRVNQKLEAQTRRDLLYKH